MPDEALLEKPADAADIAANNADVAAKLAAQDISGKSTVSESSAETDTALDALAVKHVEEKAEVEVPPVSDKPDVKPVVTSDKPDPKPTPEPEVKSTPVDKPATDLFKDSPSLPPNASPKSSEAFAAVKVRATQEISARDKAIEELKVANAALEEKLKGGLPPEIEKELQDHREWRARLDVDADPKFKEFDTTITKSREFIYAQLRKSPAIQESVIDQIKKYGGPDMIKWDDLHAKINDPTMKAIIDAQVAAIENSKWQKEEAIKATKTNIKEYISERVKANEAVYTNHNEDTKKWFAEHAKKLDWFVDKPVDPKADEAARKYAEDHNAFVAQTRKELDKAFNDDTPYMRATLLAGMAHLLWVQRVMEGTTGKLTKTEAALKEVTDKLDKFKKASVSNLRGNGAPPSSSTLKPKEGDLFNKTAGQSIEEIAADIVSKRQAVGT